MKKTIKTLVVALTLCFAATTAQAQVDFGIVGGLNLSKLSIKNAPDLSSDNRCGFYVGPKFEVTLPIVGLGVDISAQYSQRRMNAEVDANGVASSTYYKSIEIPLNVRYGVGLSSLAYFFAATGPQFGFNVGDKNWSLSNVTGNFNDFQLKKSNLTWNIGIGAKILKHFEIGAGYNIALSNFAKSNIQNLAGVTVPTNNAKLKSNSWQVQVAYFF
ncbi:MAG: PorT family protein [Bacteroidaceae bacterium]|nr:PorT family protein [Bacteroidaceae bacterium]